MSLSEITLLVMGLSVALAYPSDWSTDKSQAIRRGTIDGPGVPKISDEWNADDVAQIQQGFKDACQLAQKGFSASIAAPKSSIFTKYFPDDENTSSQVEQIFAAIVGGTPPVNTCSSLLEKFTIVKDSPNPDNHNELSCTSNDIMASTRNGNDDNKDPAMILCPSALKHGNIGPTVIKNAPAPVTCENVQADGLRITWRMDTLGSTILHEYTHYSALTEKTLPQGTKDSLNHDDDPSLPEEDTFYYGPIDIQGALRSLRNGKFSVEIADSFVWFANEVHWSWKCKVDFGLAKDGDDKDPSYGNSPGQDPDSNPGSPSLFWSSIALRGVDGTG